MTDWKFRNNGQLETVITNTNSKKCPLISVSLNGSTRCHDANGVNAETHSDFDLVKAHPCDDLKEGDLVMVWNDDEKDANLRAFIEYVPDLNTIQVHAVNSISKARYVYGLPLHEWRNRNL